MASEEPGLGPYEKLEAATGCLAKERQFFSALLTERPATIIVSRIVHLSSLYRLLESPMVQYLESNAERLFKDNSLSVAAILARLLSDISRSSRLAAYLSVKGIPDQALGSIRMAVERTGMYTHVWREPKKYLLVPDSDSKAFAEAFRYSKDRRLENSLKTQGLAYRFMHCAGAKVLSDVYRLLSTFYVHGGAGPRRRRPRSLLRIR